MSDSALEVRKAWERLWAHTHTQAMCLGADDSTASTMADRVCQLVSLSSLATEEARAEIARARASVAPDTPPSL